MASPSQRVEIARIERGDPWFAAMQRGDFAAAWRVCDAFLKSRLQADEPQHAKPRHLQNVWNGDSVDGKRVLVRCYHGLGDTIMFARLLPMLKRRAREVIVWAQLALLDLLGTIDGIDRLLPLHEGAVGVPYDIDVELMELPHVLRLQLDDIPTSVPYLHVDAPAKTIRSHRHAGLVWQAGEWNASRSIPMTLLAPLAQVRRVRWYSLQYGGGALPFRAEDASCRDLAEQSRRLHALDLVVTVDTLIAHLAGALGIPVWLLLPTPCDWRWMVHRTDSPWYPTMRIFRQRIPGDWKSVIDEVCFALSANLDQSTSITPAATAP
jgi:hypothetical protein